MAESESGLLGSLVDMGLEQALGPFAALAGNAAKTVLQHYLAPRSAPPQHLQLAIELRRAQLVALEHVRREHEKVMAQLGQPGHDWKYHDELAFNQALAAYVQQRRSLFGDATIDVAALRDDDVNDLLRWAALQAQPGANTAERRRRSEQQMLDELKDALHTYVPGHFEHRFRSEDSGWHAKWMASFRKRMDDDRALADQLTQSQSAAALIQGDRLQELMVQVLDRLPPPVASYPLARPFDFTRLIESKTQHFHGRERLIAEIERWIGDPASRAQVLLLHAPFGIGKSALMAELVRRRMQQQGAATVVHFCRWDQENTLEPGHIVRSIATQFARNLPAYAAALADEPGVRSLLDERAALEDPVTAWQRGVLGPLVGLQGSAGPRPGDVHVLLIDGLDESAERTRSGGGESLLALIAKAARGQLPPWLRVVLASRPDTTVFARRADFRFVDLLANPDGDQEADLQGYITARVQSFAAGPLAPAALAGIGLTPAGLVAAVLSISGGLFLVAEQVFRFVESDDFTPQALGQLLAQAQAVPGIESFLDWSFRERVQRQGLDVALTRDVLGAIAAARDPLPTEAIVSILRHGGEAGASPGVDADASAVRAVLHSLGGLVFERQAPTGQGLRGWTFAHQSIEDWLDPDSTPNRAEGRRPAGDYAIDRAASLRRIEALCLAIARDSAGGLAADDEFAPYLARWGVRHLMDGGHLAAAVSLLARQLETLDDPQRPGGSYRVQEAAVIEQLRLQFRRQDERPGRADVELARLDSLALQQLLRAREYETGKYQPLVRAMVQYHGADWEAFRDQLLEDDNDLVLRSDIGVAMARAWRAAAPAASPALFDRIVTLAGADEGSPQREIAGYAAKHICQRIDPPPAWWKRVREPLQALLAHNAASHSATDRMVAGEALVALAVQGEDVRRWVSPDQTLFWQPRWPNQQADIDAIHVLLAGNGAVPAGHSPAMASLIEQQALATRLGEALSTDSRFEHGAALGDWQDLRETLWPMAHQQCGKDYVGEALVVLHGLGERPEGLAFDLVRLLMLHPLWDVGECGANLLADLVKRSQGRCMAWVDALMASGDAHWRLRYGAVDAAYTAGTTDGYAKFLDVVVRAGHSSAQRDPYGRVRGICADDLYAFLEQQDSMRRRSLLAADQPLTGLLQHWLATADDIWLLEYLHALMQLLGTGRQQLPEVMRRLLAGPLSPALPRDAGRPFYELDSADFLQRVEAIRARAFNPA